MRGKLIAKKHFWAVSQAIPAFPQKLTWGYSEHPPKSAPKTTQNSRLMSKSGPFSAKRPRTPGNAAKAGRPPPKPPRTPGPRRIPHNRKPANKTRPAPRRGAGLTSSRLQSRNPARGGVWVARPSPGETKPASFIAGPSPKSTGRRSVSPPSRGRAPRGQGARPGALTPRSRCAVGARRPGRRRSRRPRISR